jgi:phosphopantetheine--protein transferase-like protein
MDLVEIDQVARSIARWGERYEHRIYTDQERRDCGSGPNRAARLAARFAAKESAIKVLRPDAEAIPWRCIEVVREPGGWCWLRLYGPAARLAAAASLSGWSVSLSHEGPTAAAVVGAMAASGPSPDDRAADVHGTMAVVDALDTWRAELGTGAGVWSASGRHVVEDGRFVALSGGPTVSVNTVVCWGGPLPDLIHTSIDDIIQSGCPSVLMLAGAALGWSQVLADTHWVCVGSTPMMHLDCASFARPTGPDPAVRRLGLADLEAARRVYIEGNSDKPASARLALPDSVTTGGPGSLWGLEDDDGRLAAIVVISRAGNAGCVWSMTTAPDQRHQGYGRRLMSAVLAELTASGCDHVLLTASQMGEDLYRSLGFTVVEHWQHWSRPRWMLGRS